MKNKLFAWLFAPSLRHDDAVVELRLNAMHLITVVTIFLSVIHGFGVLLFFRTPGPAISPLSVSLVGVGVLLLLRKKHLHGALSLYVLGIDCAAIAYLVAVPMNDAAYTFMVTSMMVGIFGGKRMVALWLPAHAIMLALVAMFHPYITFLPVQVINEGVLVVPPVHISSAIMQSTSVLLLGLVLDSFLVKLFGKITGDNRRLNQEVAERLKAQEQVSLLNNTLEERVRIRTQELARTENELQQSERLRAIGQLAGGIAHDFNNQLAGILGCADLLKSTLTENDEQYQLAKTIVSAAQRAAGLTSQLLVFSRKGKQQIVPVSVNDLVTEVVHLLQRSIDKKIHITVELGAIDKAALGDPVQFQNALLNLALNARDAIRGEGTITITTAGETVGADETRRGLFMLTAGEYVRVEVLDTGHGMDSQTLGRIFEPFFTTKPKGKGLGMGLAAVYGTMVNYGGAVSVQSSPGKGSLFTLYFPAIQEQKTIEETADLGSMSGTGTILVVDDEDFVRSAASAILRRAGYTVLEADCGERAIAVYRENHAIIDAVVLDLVMPDMNGEEVYDAIRGFEQDVAVVLSSGYSLDGTVQKIIDKGALSFVAKPYRAFKLVTAVNEACNRSMSRKLKAAALTGLAPD